MLMIVDGTVFDVSCLADRLMAAPLAIDAPLREALARSGGACALEPVRPARRASDSGGAALGARCPIGVLIASPRPTALAPLLHCMSSDPEIALLGAPVADAAALSECVARRRPRLLLLDQSLFERFDSASLHALQSHSPGMRVLLCCDAAGHALVERILQHRIQGFVLTHGAPQACLKAIRAVSRGELWLPHALLAGALREPQRPRAAGPEPLPETAQHPLTRRETEIVAHLREGFTNKEIARRLGIMEDTVKKHLQSVFGKLGVRRRSLVALRQSHPA